MTRVSSTFPGRYRRGAAFALAGVFLFASASFAAGGTEVFTGIGEGAQPREKPTTPASTYWRVQMFIKPINVTPGSRIQVLLPLSDSHQQVISRRFEAPGYQYREEPTPPNLEGTWTRTSPEQNVQILFNLEAVISDSVEKIPVSTTRDAEPRDSDRGDLQPAPLVQSNDPEIRKRARDLTADSSTTEEMAWALFQHTAAFVRAAPGEAREDALSVLRKGSGSTAGKARLLAALLRASGIPARIVGGLKLEDSTKKRATISWCEARVGGSWIPMDPGGGYFGWLPNQYLTLYRDDLPLIVHSASIDLEYDFVVHRIRKEPSSLDAGPTRPSTAGATRPVTPGIRIASSYVEHPVGTVVMIADEEVDGELTEMIFREAREAELNVVLLHAPFESRYFREQYLQKLVSNNLELIQQADVILVKSHDDAGLYALLALGERQLRIEDRRILIAGKFGRPIGNILGAVLCRLVDPGEVVLVNRPARLLALWAMVRENVLNGVPMTEEGRKWDLAPWVLNQRAYEELPAWRRGVVDAWARAVRAQVPLQALNLILVLPVIAALIVIVRTFVGLDTFGTFSPVIVSLAFLTTGLAWGLAIFALIVGIGAAVRLLLQRVRLQLVARLAILITVVAGIMAGMTVLGASFGIGALMNVSIFPMVIMSNVIENFALSRAQSGTREAVRLTLNTLALAAFCYLVIETAGLQALLLSFPELLLAAVLIDIALGKWRGLRLLEYRRFLGLTRPSDRWNS